MKITNIPKRVNLPVAKLFELTSNCKNIAQYFSNEVTDINATEDSCTFTIENFTQISLKILDKKPFTFIRLEAENDKNIPLFIVLKFTEISVNETEIVTELDIDIPVFFKPVIEKSLQRFIDTFSEKIRIEVVK